MEALLENWNVVASGAWNVRLFTPEWLSNNVFNTKNLNIEMGIGAGIQAFRFVSEDAIFLPADNQIICGVRKADKTSLIKAEGYVSKVLELLSHTPVLGVGINLAFVEEDPASELVNLFNVADVKKLSEASYEISEAEIKRVLKMEGSKGVINARLAYADGKITADLNYHFPVLNATEAKASLTGAAEKAHDQTVKFLSDIYDLQLGQE